MKHEITSLLALICMGFLTGSCSRTQTKSAHENIVQPQAIKRDERISDDADLTDYSDLKIEKLRNYYDIDKPLRFKIFNRKAKADLVQISLIGEDKEGIFSSFGGVMADIFSQYNEDDDPHPDKPHPLFRIPGNGFAVVSWTPNARPKNYLPSVRKRYRFEILTRDALQGGGLTYSSSAFRLRGKK